MKKPLTVKEFLSNNKFLVIFLIAIFVFSLLAYIIIFWGKLYDVSAWGSLVAGIFTYIGSSFLGVVVFYNTKSQQRQKEIEDQILVDTKCSADFDFEKRFFIPFQLENIDRKTFKFNETTTGKMPIGAKLKFSECSFLFFDITNRNTHIPIYVKPVSFHTFGEDKKVKDYYSFCMFSDTSNNDAIDYKQTKGCYIGISNSIIDKEYYKKNEHQFFYIVIKIESFIGEVVYAILFFSLGKTLGSCKPIIIPEKTYNENASKHSSPIVPYINIKHINFIKGYTND